MARLTKRPKDTSWVAIITKSADSSKQCRKSTFITITQPDKKEAQAVANGCVAVYRSRILYTKQADIFRANAGTTADEQKALGKRQDGLCELGSVSGTDRRMPTIREYLKAFQHSGEEQNIRNCRRACTLFLTHLGHNADMRLNRLTPEHCQSFIDTQTDRIRSGTVERYRSSFSAALNAAAQEMKREYFGK